MAVELSRQASGTGWLVRRRLTQFIAETAEALAREAEKPVPS